MYWFILALMGAFFQATYFMLIKKYIKKTDLYQLAGGSFIFASFIITAFLLKTGLPSIGDRFYHYAALTIILEIAATMLYFSAMEISDLSLAVPMLSFNPAFMILTAYLILGEYPTAYGVLGIFLIILGSYSLGLKNNQKELLLPFKELLRDRGTRYMIFVALIYSVEINFVKITVIESSPIFAAATLSIIIGIIFFGISAAKNKGTKEGVFTGYKYFVIIGGVLALQMIVMYHALILQIVPYVMSVKRFSSLFGVIYGAVIFHERNISKRIGGALIMLMGSVVILFS